MRAFVCFAMVLASGASVSTTESVVGDSSRYSAKNFSVTRCPGFLTRFLPGFIEVLYRARPFLHVGIQLVCQSQTQLHDHTSRRKIAQISEKGLDNDVCWCQSSE